MGGVVNSCPFYFYCKCSLKTFSLAVPHSVWDLSSPGRDGTYDPCSGSAES